VTWPARWQTLADYERARTLEAHGMDPLDDATEGVRRGIIDRPPRLATRPARADEWPGWDVSSGLPRKLQ
jgi:hypothetical protein